MSCSQEYAFEDYDTVARIFNDNIMQIVNIITSTVKSVQRLKSVFHRRSIDDIIDDFVNAIKTLPRLVRNLSKGARFMVKRLAVYADLPPVYTRVIEVITKIKTLFNDIKTDIMSLYDVSSVVIYLSESKFLYKRHNYSSSLSINLE